MTVPDEEDQVAVPLQGGPVRGAQCHALGVLVGARGLLRDLAGADRRSWALLRSRPPAPGATSLGGNRS